METKHVTTPDSLSTGHIGKGTDYHGNPCEVHYPGLTKLETFASQNMAACMDDINHHTDTEKEDVLEKYAKLSVLAAKTLIKALNEQQ